MADTLGDEFRLEYSLRPVAAFWLIFWPKQAPFTGLSVGYYGFRLIITPGKFKTNISLVSLKPSFLSLASQESCCRFRRSNLACSLGPRFSGLWVLIDIYYNILYF